MRIVVNASPLILLTACDQLELLRGLATETVVPSAVVAELEAGGARDRAATAVVSASWVSVTEPSSIPGEIAAWDLGAGETAVLAWAAAHPGTIPVLDDRAGRSCAQTLGLPVIGTLGVVLAAKEAGLIPAARPLVDAMIEAGYYLAGDVLSAALRKVGE